MKARVQTGAVLLCCFENPDEQDVLRRFFTQRRIAVYTAGSEDLGRAVGPLLGQPGGAAQPQDAAAAVPPEPALVFSALSDRSLEQVLTALREQQLAAGCLKAVLTPHNRGWRWAHCWRSCGVSAAPSHPKRRLRRAAPAHKTRRGYPAKSGEP